MVKNKDVEESQLVAQTIKYWEGFLDSADWTVSTAKLLGAPEDFVIAAKKYLDVAEAELGHARQKLHKLRRRKNNASRNKKRTR